jgi:hypothetical protein
MLLPADAVLNFVQHHPPVMRKFRLSADGTRTHHVSGDIAVKRKKKFFLYLDAASRLFRIEFIKNYLTML